MSLTKSNAATIFALSSAPGRAGVAVIRVSGHQARGVIETLCPPLPAPRQTAFRTLRHPATGDAIDQAVVFWFAGPKSETGEDVAELQVHGGRAVVQATLDALASLPGLRLAEPGEFAKRAFHNGKLDLAEVEGLADLIDAETDAQRRQALAQAGGSLSRLYGAWRTRLIEIAGLVEASLDFSDEGDVAAAAFDQARSKAQSLHQELAAHLDDGRRGEILRDGFRVALIGAPNVGKSSLLNALARRDVAIVSPEAGTTRDIVEVRLDLKGVPVIVSDTAGLRDAEGLVEREGIRRSMAAAKQADLIIWLDDGCDSNLPAGFSRETQVKVRTKIDVNVNDEARDADFDFAISSVTGSGLASLIDAIADRAAIAAGLGQLGGLQPAVTQARHRQHLSDATAALGAFLDGEPQAAELRAEDVRQAAQALGRVTGHVDAEDVLGQIFSRFCIGK